MRITSGKYRGLPIKSPPGDRLRPTQDLVREALFDILRDKTTDSVFLDLCAGTGAVGLEALSRGASEVFLVEKNRANSKIIQANIKMLKDSDPKVIYGDAAVILRSFENRQKFDIIFADPPYEKHGENPLLKKIISISSKYELLNDGGIIIFEQASREQVPEAEDFEIIKEKKYGRTKLTFYQKK
ncbi:MAG: 16S rRNA (guanine(966)-N(2))-methyltransferase RsmD [Kiritimatiellae bacterium]|jgi:16S rRNA (guanine966-N2)-methyltransferase|nr:16S rRNA (guanine(966)-N(2))-methyltransferase RsmD [Kiritimatiellia bacterium]